jgi:hypothetical protein
MTTAINPTRDGRIWSFSSSYEAYLVVLFTDQKVALFNPTGPVVSNNLVTDPTFQNGAANWTERLTGATSLVLFAGYNTRLIPETGGSAGIAQQVTTTSGGSAHVVRVSTTGDARYRVRVGTSEGDGSYLDTYSFSDTGVFTFTPAGDYWITVDAENDQTVTLQTIVSYVDSSTAEVNFNTPYPNDVLNDLYFVTVPDPSPDTDASGDTNTLYVLHPNYSPYKLTYEPSTDTYDFVQVSFTSPPANWTGTNWPACGTYFQGRLWLAATPNRGQRFWASKSNLPENFDQGAGDLADDSLEFTLNELGRIEWMVSTKNLVIGTTYGEHLVGSDDGVIKPNDIRVEQQSAYGSKSVQPIQIGDEVLFTSPDGLKLRAMQYDFTKDNWISRDVTFFSEHITESGIRNMAWAQNPSQELWCALENGKCAVLSYERGEGVYGWARQETDGFYRDFTSAILNGTSYVLALTQRENDSLYLEIQDEDVYLDSYIDSTSNTPTTTFTGYDHLVGLTVKVILDGALHPDVVVAGDGSITTEWEGVRCEAGLGYTATMETLPLDQQVQTGSAQPYYKRYDQLLVTMLDSALPVINGEMRPDRTPATPMDTREPDSVGVLRTEQVVLGWDQNATVTIEQPLPLPLTVLSISGRLALEKL